MRWTTNRYNTLEKTGACSPLFLDTYQLDAVFSCYFRRSHR